MKRQEVDLKKQMREQCDHHKRLLAKKMARNMEIAAYRWEQCKEFKKKLFLITVNMSKPCLTSIFHRDNIWCVCWQNSKSSAVAWLTWAAKKASNFTIFVFKTMCTVNSTAVLIEAGWEYKRLRVFHTLRRWNTVYPSESYWTELYGNDYALTYRHNMP